MVGTRKNQDTGKGHFTSNLVLTHNQNIKDETMWSKQKKKTFLSIVVLLSVRMADT